MAAMGHEDAFPRPRAKGLCRFSQRTFAGTRGNLRGSPRSVAAFGLRRGAFGCHRPFACGTRLVITQIARRGDADLEKLTGNGRFRLRLSKSRGLPGAPSRGPGAPSPPVRRATLQQSRSRGVLGPPLRSTLRHSSRKGSGHSTAKRGKERRRVRGNISDADPRLGPARPQPGPILYTPR